MSQLDKLKIRLKSIPKDFTYTEARSLLISLGFIEFKKGKTSGSRVKFYRSVDNKMIMLHKPHPGDVIKTYAVKEIVQFLIEIGEIE